MKLFISCCLVFLQITSFNAAEGITEAANELALLNEQIQSAITLPTGFTIEVVASNVKSARYLSFSPDGKVVFVGTYADALVALLDRDADGYYEEIVNVTNVLKATATVVSPDKPYYLYIANPSQLMRAPMSDVLAYVYDKTNPAPFFQVLYNFTKPSQVHFLRFGPDQLLYASNPSLWDSKAAIPDPYATILRMNTTQSPPTFTIFARGVRDCQGFDWHPVTQEMWFSDNGCDFLGNDFPPDEINKANIYTNEILDWGFPFCYGLNQPDPTYNNTCSITQFEPAAGLLMAHVAPLVVQFYNATSFPESYWNQLFVITHGSTYRKPKDGYNILLAQLDPTGTNITSVDTFAYGWLLANQTVWGRPSALATDPIDGSLLISDDRQNLVYRISWTG